MSHEKYLKKALISLGISDMIKEIRNFEKLEQLISFLENAIIQMDYSILLHKDVIKNYEFKKQEANELLKSINSMLSDSKFSHKKKDLIRLKSQAEDAIYELDECYIDAKDSLPQLYKSIEDANRLLPTFREVEPQCLVEEIKALNKGKNYEYFAVA